MILRGLIQIDTRVYRTTLSDFGVSRYSQLTACGLYFHFNRVLLMVVHKMDSLIVLLDAIDSHARLAVSGAALYDDDMIGRFPVAVVQREPLPIRREARCHA